jgi:CitMHS family citrate-Mg2+:H+ or citrate-Ca2+:H+ symporter
MASILFAAGVFTGIMSQSGMLSAMAMAAVGFVPPKLASHIPAALGCVSMPLSMLFDPDSFYFGVLPVIAEVSGMLGVPHVQVAQAALLGQMTTGFPFFQTYANLTEAKFSCRWIPASQGPVSSCVCTQDQRWSLHRQ